MDCLGRHCLREIRNVDGGYDDADVDGQDGENDAGQKDEGQLVDILHADKHHRGHGDQKEGPVHAHVVQQGGLCLGALQALEGKDGRLGTYVDLKQKVMILLFSTVYIQRYHTCNPHIKVPHNLIVARGHHGGHSSTFPPRFFIQPAWGFKLGDTRSQACSSSLLFTAEFNQFQPGTKTKQNRRNTIREVVKA